MTVKWDPVNENMPRVMFCRKLFLLEVFQVAAGETSAVRHARTLDLPDFEDALQAVAAQTCKAEAIITRNLRDYANAVH